MTSTSKNKNKLLQIVVCCTKKYKLPSFVREWGGVAVGGRGLPFLITLVGSKRPSTLYLHIRLVLPLEWPAKRDLWTWYLPYLVEWYVKRGSNFIRVKKCMLTWDLPYLTMTCRRKVCEASNFIRVTCKEMHVNLGPPLPYNDM